MLLDGHIQRSVLDLQGKSTTAFASPLDAVRFCHVAQVALMFGRWPADGAAVCFSEEHNVEGRLIFAGPRVAMALHTSTDFMCALLILSPACLQKMKAFVRQESAWEEQTLLEHSKCTQMHWQAPCILAMPLSILEKRSYYCVQV